MPIVNVSELLKKADTEKCAVLAFNCGSYMQIEAILETAEELGKPVICMLDPDHAINLHWTNLESYAAIVKSLAAGMKTPVSFHLDHCRDFDYIVKALNCGFPSVMYDGSMLPIEENIAKTAEVAKVAHALGADVEAEIGHVGFAATRDGEKEDQYTQPDVAAAFCEQTGCDSVAVAIGSAHGFYVGTPKLDLKRLKEIDSATNVPLVLHGGSGIPDDQLREAFKLGINKLNVGTEIGVEFLNAMRTFSSDVNVKAGMGFPVQLHKTMKAYLKKKLELCDLVIKEK